MRAFRLLPALLLVALPAWGQKVHIDYDGATAFSEFRTFQLRETPMDLNRVSTSLHQRTMERLREFAVTGGLEEADADPDVYIAYYAAHEGDLRLTLSDLDYAYGPGLTLGSYWEGGVGTREITKKPFVFKEGTIIVDAWDRERGLLVWRGMATSVLKKDREKNAKRLEKALDKLMKQWEEMYGARARALRKLKVEQDG